MFSHSPKVTHTQPHILTHCAGDCTGSSCDSGPGLITHGCRHSLSLVKVEHFLFFDQTLLFVKVICETVTDAQCGLKGHAGRWTFDDVSSPVED